MVGAVVGGLIQDRYGLRWSLRVGSFISAIAVAICFVSYLPDEVDPRRGIFLAGKLIQGFAIGMTICTAQTYMSEILPCSLRGPVMALFPVSTLLGQLVGAAVVFVLLHREGSSSYVMCFASQWPFSVLPILAALSIPESPTYLIRKDKLDAALHSLKCLNTAKVDSQAALVRITSISPPRATTSA